MSSLKNKVWLQIFIIYTRYLIGSAFVFASIVKIKGNRFTTDSGELNPINSSWHFFETLYQSGLYWKFLGLAQLIAGFLLMTQRYAKLGALMNLPIIANVFVITISYYFAFTPVITGLMLIANILLVLWDWNTLKVLINLAPQPDETLRLENDNIWQLLGVLLFAIVVITNMSLSARVMSIAFVVGLFIGLTGLIIGLKRKKRYHIV
jgi:hypothetical protein